MNEQVFDPKQDWTQFRVLVQELHLVNFRGFQGLTLDFEEDLTVFISKNGGGKSSILDAVWAGLQHLDVSLFKQSHGKVSLSRLDVNNQAETDAAQIELFTGIDVQWWEERDYGEEDEGEEDEGEEDEGRVETELVQSATKVQASVTINRETDKQAASLNEQKVDKDNWYPLLKLLRTHFRNKTENRTDSRPLFRYFRTGDQKRSRDVLSFEQMQEWVDKRQKLVRHSGKAYPRFEAEWKWVEEAITTVLSDDDTQYNGLQVEYRPSGDYLVINKQLSGHLAETLSVEQLSSGERILFTIVMDIAIRLIELNPSNHDNPLTDGFGVVLIDEVGIHLHPSWQRRVMGTLRAVFPKVQFVVTTHSPMLLQNLQKRQLRRLANGQIDSQEIYIEGRKIGAVTRDAFGLQKYPEKQPDGARSVEPIEWVRACYDLIDDGKYEQAEELLKKIRGTWGPNDETVTELSTLLQMARMENT